MATWYIRKTGADTNGGSSSSPIPERSGTDATTTSTTTVTSNTAAFSAADIGKGINIGGTPYRIAGYTNPTTITIDRNYGTAGSGRTWNIGGALQTINKLTNINATTLVQAGDTIYIGPGTYRENVVVGTSYTGTQTRLVGDVTGTNTGDTPGPVVLTAFLSGDNTTGSGTALSINSKNYWSVENLTVYAATGTTLALGLSQNITFTRCWLISSNSSIGAVTVTAGQASNVIFERCYLYANSSTPMGLTISLSTADYPINVEFRNSVLAGGSFGPFTPGGTGAGKPGGVKIINSTFISNGSAVSGVSNVSTTHPFRVENCVIYAASTIFSAAAVGQIIENGNVLYGPNPYSNVTAGANTVRGNPRITTLNEVLYGGTTRPVYSPLPDSVIIGKGHVSDGGTYDYLGKERPPNLARRTTGAFEPHNNWVKETVVVRSGTTALSVAGVGNQDFDVPVTPVPTTMHVWMRHSGQTDKPKIFLVNCHEVGVAETSTTMTAAADTWEELTLTFTPTREGIVTIRIASRDTGTAYADDITVTT